MSLHLADLHLAERCDIRGCVIPATRRWFTEDGERVDLCERHSEITEERR